MERKRINLHFGNDVYTVETKDNIPFKKGIYMAFAGKYNGKYVELRKLLYIGMGDETPISERISDHAAKQHFLWLKEHCERGEKIYYRVAELDKDIRLTEATLIFKHKPDCNTDDKDRYNGTRPAPDITTDLAMEDISGAVIDCLSLNKYLNEEI